jgi:hypothetical protein
MFKSAGQLQYSDNPYKLIVEVDSELADYYRSFVPPVVGLNKPMYPAHISVVRNEIPLNLFAWNKYKDIFIFFEYEGEIYNDELYYWLNAYCEDLEKIRFELGLPETSEITRSPDGRHKFHITLGNLKNKKP